VVVGSADVLKEARTVETNIPVYLAGHTVRISEPPAIKTRQLDNGDLEPVTNRDGVVQFVVAVFVKPKAVDGQRPGKGSEIRVNLPADPGEGFTEGSVVELINPLASLYAIADSDNPRLTANAGMWFKADGLKPAVDTPRAAYASPAGSYDPDEQ
jgi:hypothetical protein